MGRPGLTRVWNSSTASPSRTLTAPTSMIASRSELRPVVSRSRATYVRGTASPFLLSVGQTRYVTCGFRPLTDDLATREWVARDIIHQPGWRTETWITASYTARYATPAHVTAQRLCPLIAQG